MACNEGPKVTAHPATAKNLAALILAMNYGELRSVASDFSEMIEKDVRPKVETPQEFAELLIDWAEAQS